MEEGTKAGMQAGTQSAGVHHWQLSAGRSCRGFTLTELLVVIGLIILLVIVALPAWNFISGGRSQEAAINTVSAVLGRARELALASQSPRGVFFFPDAGTGRVAMAIVQYPQVSTWQAAVDYEPGDLVVNSAGTNLFVAKTAHTSTTGGSYALSSGANWEPLGMIDDALVYPENTALIDMVDDTDVELLQPGIGLMMIDNTIFNPASSTDPDDRQDDAYLRCGLILFDGEGQLIVRNWAVLAAAKVSQLGTRMAWRNAPAADEALPVSPGSYLVASELMPSQVGFVLYDRQAYENQPGHTPLEDQDLDDPDGTRANGNSNYAANERDEEKWLDDNALPVLVNRYNGTLVKGE